MLKKQILASALAAGASLCAWALPYRIIAPMDPTDNGAMARLINYDTGETIDSTIVAHNQALFNGDIDEPIMARILLDGRRQPVFILENGTVSFSQKGGGAFGTMLNDQWRALTGRLTLLQHEYRNAAPERQDAIEREFNAALDSVVAANPDNALGLLALLNTDISQYSAAGILRQIEGRPYFAASHRIQTYLENARRRESTQPGNMFTDFEIHNANADFRLSDHVGKGHYVLVDFWASWCGPCMRQLPVLKDIYNTYADQGLEVIGVAVWDEPDDTRAAIQSHELPWECVVDAGNIPTDIYGISGIPCIILFGPDGTIISRDKQGDELRADVDAAMRR